MAVITRSFFSLAFVAFASSVHALPAQVLTGLSDMPVGALIVAGAVLLAFVTIFAFKFLRKSLHSSGSPSGSHSTQSQPAARLKTSNTSSRSRSGGNRSRPARSRTISTEGKVDWSAAEWKAYSTGLRRNSYDIEEDKWTQKQWAAFGTGVIDR
jgi:hypothetical protein